MSDELEWAKILAGVAGGGLAGAILTNAISYYRGRIQPIGNRIEITPLFTASFTGSTLQPTLTLTVGENVRQFPNLHLVEVTIVNRGHRDFAEFPFGITLDSADSCVHAESVSSDRHHLITPVLKVTPDNPSATLDFSLRPFNRKDVYILKLFVVAAGVKPGTVKLGSSEAVKFVTLPTMVELFGTVAAEVIIPALNTRIIGYR